MVKGIKINLYFIFNNFPVYRTGLRLVYIYIIADSYNRFYQFIFVIFFQQWRKIDRFVIMKPCELENEL